MIFSHWFHYFYIPANEVWYKGQIWSNLFVVAVLAPLGYIWSKTKFWPLVPLKHGINSLHSKIDAQHKKQNEHNVWMARTLHELHIKTDGNPPSFEHPHYKL